MASDAKDFHIEEFKQIKSEISILLNRIEALIKFALFGGVAIYAWVLTNFPGDTAANTIRKNLKVIEFAACLPPAVLIFSASLLVILYSYK